MRMLRGGRIGRVTRRLESLLGRATPLVAGRALSAALTVVVPMVLARRLSRDDFGHYKQFFLVFMTVYLVGQLGLTQSLYYFLPRERAERGRFLGQTLTGLVAVGALVGLAIASVPWFGPYRAPLALYCAIALATAPLESALTGLGRIGLSASVYVVFEVLRAAGLCVGAVWFGGLSGALWGATATVGLRLCALAALVAARFLPVAAPSGPALRRQLAYALPYAGAALLYVAQRQLGQYVVSIEFDAATYAIFMVGAFHMVTVDMVYTPVSEVLIVELSGAAAASDPAAARRVWHETLLRLAELFLPMTALFYALGHVFIAALFTTKYAASVPVFWIMTLEVPLGILALDAVMRAAAETRFLFRVNALRVVGGLLLVLLGIRLAGLAGAAAGMVAAEAAGRLLMLRRARLTLRCRWRDLAPWRALGTMAVRAALPVAPAAMLSHRLDRSPKLALAAGGAVYLLLFALLALAGRLRTRARSRAAAAGDGQGAAGGLEASSFT